MPIVEISQAINTEEIPKRRIEDREKPAPVKGEEESLSPKADRVEVSEEARNLYKILSLVNVKAALKKLPDTREERIEEAKVKVREDFYFSKEVCSVIADRLLKMLTLE